MTKSLKKTIIENFNIDNEIQGIGMDIIGDSAIINLPEVLQTNSKKVAELILNENKQIKSIYLQKSKIKGKFRTREVQFIIGEKKEYTAYKENGCTFLIDISNVYFSPRLSTERLRISNMVKTKETILNMFAGVGPFSIIISKNNPDSFITNIEINPLAHELSIKNTNLNNMSNRIKNIQGDVKDILDDSHQNKFDRILMPLPEDSLDYLDIAINVIKPNGFIHIYHHTFSSINSTVIDESIEKMEKIFPQSIKIVDCRIVKETGPRWFQVVFDCIVNKN